MPNTPPTFQASGNINASRFVAISGDRTIALAGANARTIGISMEGTNVPPLDDLVTTAYAAASGQSLRIFGEGDVCLLELAANTTVAAGDRLKSDASGNGVPIATSGTTIQQIGAIALEGVTGAAGVLPKILVQITHFSERPALA